MKRFPEHLWPECAVCGVPVAKMHDMFDELTRQFIIVAECHGAHERVDIPVEFFEAGYETVRAGKAFLPVAGQLEERKP